jgi:hypothetical protein
MEKNINLNSPPGPLSKNLERRKVEQSKTGGKSKKII